jgi:ribosomal protein S18 acetylase RimI-like enzyme
MLVLSGDNKEHVMEIELRDVNKNDFSWLFDLRSKTMSKYILDSGDQFSYESQTDRIMKEFDSINIVRIEDRDVGMFKVKQETDKWTIIQIQILPEYQGLGIGKNLILDCQEKAVSQRIPVYLSVLKVNPAKSLYERLGFEIVEVKEKSYTMRYSA